MPHKTNAALFNGLWFWRQQLAAWHDEAKRLIYYW